MGTQESGHIGSGWSPGPWRNRKKVKCCGRPPGVISLPRQGHSRGTARTARGHYRGALGVTTGVSWVLPRGYYRGHCPGHRVPDTGRGLAKFRRLHRSLPPGRDLHRETPRVQADLFRPVRDYGLTGRGYGYSGRGYGFFWQSPAVLLENPVPGQSIRSYYLTPEKDVIRNSSCRILQDSREDGP